MTNPPTFKTVAEIARACEVDATTAKKWTGQLGFPAKVKGAWPSGAVQAFALARFQEDNKAQRGKNTDIRSVHIFQKIQKLKQDVRKSTAEADMAEREAEMHKIETDAKKKLWFSLEQVKTFAHLVVSGFDEAREAVATVTRDEKAVAAVQSEFDRIRKKLAKQVGEIK